MSRSVQEEFTYDAERGFGRRNLFLRHDHKSLDYFYRFPDDPRSSCPNFFHLKFLNKNGASYPDDFDDQQIENFFKNIRERKIKICLVPHFNGEMVTLSADTDAHIFTYISTLIRTHKNPAVLFDRVLVFLFLCARNRLDNPGNVREIFEFYLRQQDEVSNPFFRIKDDKIYELDSAKKQYIHPEGDFLLAASPPPSDSDSEAASIASSSASETSSDEKGMREAEGSPAPRVSGALTPDLEAGIPEAKLASIRTVTLSKELESVQTIRVKASKELESVQTIRVKASKELESVQTIRVKASKELESVQIVRVKASKELESSQIITVKASKELESSQTVTVKAPKELKSQTVRIEAPIAICENQKEIIISALEYAQRYVEEDELVLGYQSSSRKEYERNVFAILNSNHELLTEEKKVELRWQEQELNKELMLRKHWHDECISYLIEAYPQRSNPLIPDEKRVEYDPKEIQLRELRFLQFRWKKLSDCRVGSNPASFFALRKSGAIQSIKDAKTIDEIKEIMRALHCGLSSVLAKKNEGNRHYPESGLAHLVNDFVDSDCQNFKPMEKQAARRELRVVRPNDFSIVYAVMAAVLQFLSEFLLAFGKVAVAPQAGVSPVLAFKS